MRSQKNWRVLVCEPDLRSQEIIREYLQGSPIKAFFTSAAEPLENTLAKHSPINAVIIDLSDPAKSFCNRLISSVKHVSPSAEVIFMSRLADEMLWSQVLAMGAYDLLPAPPERREFLRTLFSAVHHTQAAA
jgi:DNA-binding NtrC family response regulator